MFLADAMKNLSAQQVKQFFIPKEATFEVVRTIREMVIFANHNIIKDAAFTKIDLVSCRNMLIYMQPALQQQVLHNIHFSLKQAGFLFLGKSENIGPLENEFEIIQRKWNVYQKCGNSRLPTLSYLSAYRGANALVKRASALPSSQPRFDPLIEAAFAALLENRIATCILVNRDNQLLHVCGDALKLLRIVPGRASQDLLKMMPTSLNLPLSTALHRARLQDQKVRYSNCAITEKDYGIDLVSIEVSKQKSQNIGYFLMILIEAVEAPETIQPLEASIPDPAAAQYVLQLQHELQNNRENLQATVEELEVTNEEQQTTNEELTASNEELQSTNEELHSVNEELYTVNAEHQSKIQALSELNNDLDNLLGSIDIGVVYLDSDMRVRRFTPAATMTFNLVSADIGRPLQHLSHNLEDVEIDTVLERASHRASQQGERTELGVKLKDKGPYLLMQIFPYKNENDDDDGLILTLVNVNEMKLTQQQLSAAKEALDTINVSLEKQVKERTTALRESQQLLHSITESMPNGIYVYDLKTQSNIYANSFLERLLGYSAQDIQALGERLNEHLFHPEDVEKIERYHRSIVDSSKPDGHIFAVEYRVQDSEGCWRDFYSQDTVFKRDAEGNAWQIVGTATDVSDRKAASLKLQESETRYRHLYQHAPVMMHSIDLAGNILSVSDQWLIRLGYREEEVLSKPIATLLSDEFKPVPESTDIPIWLNENGCEQFDCQFVCKNREVIDVQLSAVADKNADGSVQRLLTVLIDVTERNRAEKEISQYREHLEELVASRAQQLQDTNEKLKAEVNERIQAQAELDLRAASLERSNADLEQFAYVVSHDLQEPIRAMTVFSQLLQQRYAEKLDNVATSYLKNIVEGGIRMQALIDGILEFSRITHRGEQFEPIDLEALVATVIAGLSTTLQQQNVSVTVGQLPTVNADSNQISQLFQNLISNAVKFKSDQPPIIHITAEAQSTEEGNDSDSSEHWLFSVKDNGMGISEDQQERIFALFQRLHTRQEFAGYGIGLAICKKIIERHNGSIWIESALGEGATFFFTLGT